MDNSVELQSLQNEYWNTNAPFATPQLGQLCHSIVDNNLGKTKLNIILTRWLIVPDDIAQSPDQMSQLIANMEEMNTHLYELLEISINIEGKPTPFW